jgi:hypothetical protein
MTNVDYVSIVTEAGTAITLDGAPVAGFVPIPGTRYECVRVAVADGLHVVEGSLPFEIFTHGYDDYDSYAYPGGVWTPHSQNICQIPIPPIVVINDIGLPRGTLAEGEGEIDIEAILECLPPPPPVCPGLLEDSQGNVLEIPQACCYAMDDDLPQPAPDEFLPKKGYCVEPPCPPTTSSCDLPPCQSLFSGVYIGPTSIDVSLVSVRVGGIDPCAPCPAIDFFAGTTGLWVQGHVNPCEINCEDLMEDVLGNPTPLASQLCATCVSVPDGVDVPLLGECGGIVPGCDLVNICGLDLGEIIAVPTLEVPAPCLGCLSHVTAFAVEVGNVPKASSLGTTSL